MICLTRFLPARLLYRYYALAFVLTAVFFFSGLVLASPAAASTVIAHQVTGEETWTKEGSPYIICEGAGVAADATLTIEDGVEVQLGYGKITIGETVYSVSPTFTVAGDLNATGTTFTAFTGSGGTGEWSAIRFVHGSSGTFTTCNFVYGGEGAATYSMVMVDDHTANVQLTFSNCMFEKNAKGLKGGIYFRAGSDSSLTVKDSTFTELSQSIGVHSDTAPDATITICNCTISNVATGSKDWAAMSVRGGTATITGCTFNSNGGSTKECNYCDVDMWDKDVNKGPYQLTFTGNDLDGGGIDRYPLIIASQTRINEGIENAGNTFANYADGYRYLPVMGDIPAGAAAYWGEIGLEYLVERDDDEHSLEIRANDSAIGSLTIAPGRTVYFKGSAAGISMWGSITARGTTEELITFAPYPGEQPNGKFDIPFPILGGGIDRQRSNVFFEHCVFDGLQKGIEVSCSNADYVNEDEISLTVRNCTFRNIPECAVYIYGDVYSIDHGNVLIEGCTITNCGETLGPEPPVGVLHFEGLESSRRCSPRILNTVVANNGGMATGVVLSYSNAVLENCTISANRFMGVYQPTENSAVIKNSILWGNTGGDLQASADQVQVSYSCIGTPPPDFDLGETNISEDPLFADSANGDLHLKSEAGRWDPAAQAWVTDDVTSPCIDAGDPASDYSNEPEPNGGRINMGAYGDTVYASKSVGAEQIVITTSSPLSTGVVGYEYQNIQVKLEVSGGSPPYTWEIVQGSLPDGLILDSESGQIYGTPRAAGDFVFTVSVTDGVSSVSKEFEISIIEAGSPEELWIDFVDGGIEPPTAVLPLDKGIKHRFTVKNSTAKHLILEIAAATATGEPVRIMIMNPQGPVLYLEPGEEQWVTAILEPGAAEVGTHSVTINYTFINSFDRSEKKIYSCEYQYQVLAVEPYEAADFTGDFVVSGTVEDENGRPVTGALVELAWAAGATHGHNTPLIAETGADGNFSFSVRQHPNWYLRVSKEGYKDAYAFGLTREPLTITLQPFSGEVPQYERVKQVQTVAGFWKYVVDENEKVILLANGMENWQDPGLKDQSKLMLYTLDGDLLWEYAAGWETWGADLSRDGKWAACVTNGKPGAVPDSKDHLTLLDAETGEVVWQKEVVEENFPRAAGLGALPHSLEVQFSHDASYLGIGMVNGDFHLLNRTDGSVIWSRFTEGQVRRVLFSPDDQYVYVGSGSGRLYKFETADGNLLWQTRIWSWPYTYGLDLSPDGTLIAAGTKSGEVSVIKTSDGTKLWDYDMGIMCTRWVQFSPDGELLAAGSGAPCGTTVFDADTGEVLWRTGFSAAGMFTADGEYLFIGEGTGKLFTRDGTLVTDALDPGFTGTASGYWKTAYISSDRSRIVLAARDMEPNTVGIAFFRAVTGEDITLPTVPSSLRVTDRTSSSITFAWDASTDDSGIEEYIIEMKQREGEFAEVGTTADTSFTKTGLSPATTYTFRVRAKDTAGNVSAWSDELEVTTLSSSSGGGGGSSSHKPHPSSPALTLEPSSTGDAAVISIGEDGLLAIPSEGARQLVEQGYKKVTVQSAQPALTAVIDDSARDILSGAGCLISFTTPQVSVTVPAAKLPAGEVTVSIQPARDPDTQALLQVVQVSRPDVQPLSGVFDVSIASSSNEETKQVTLVFHFSPEQGDDDPDTWFITLLNDDGSISVIPANEIIRGDQGNVTGIKAELPHLSKYLLMKYSSSFTDLKAHWAKRDVLLMAARRVVSGMSRVKFAPDKPVTRAQFAALLLKTLNLREEKPAEPTFSDVLPDKWYYGAVEAAYRAGLISGLGDGRFAPEKEISRQEMAVMIARALKYRGDVIVTSEAAEQLLSNFRDQASISRWARADVALCVQNGIIKGRPDNTFAPLASATRAESVVILKKFLINQGIV